MVRLCGSGRVDHWWRQSFDPLGQLTVTAGRDHCFRTHFLSGRVDLWWHLDWYFFFQKPKTTVRPGLNRRFRDPNFSQPDGPSGFTRRVNQISQGTAFISQGIVIFWNWSTRPTHTRPIVITIFVRVSVLKFQNQANKTDLHCRSCVGMA